MTLNEQDQRLHRRLDRLARIVAALKRVAACWYSWELDAALAELEEARKE
jgi:hypothetical protein